MGSDALRSRAVWQDYSGRNAGVAEKSFFDVFENLFQGTEFHIRRKVREFASIYVNVELTEDVLAQIYTPDEAIKYHGVAPDYAIENRETGKIIYVEVKRQDGWVEGKPRSAGRGNAHERSCKYFTPGLINVLRGAGGIAEPALPFWTVFQGDITRDPCRVREIKLWYADFDAHYFMWRDTKNPEPLAAHFEDHLKRLIST